MPKPNRDLKTLPEVMSNSTMTPENKALIEAIEMCGGVTATAIALKLGQSAVSRWKQRGQVSDTACRKLESLTSRVKGGHTVSVYRLRPDIFGTKPKAKPRTAA